MTVSPTDEEDDLSTDSTEEQNSTEEHKEGESGQEGSSQSAESPAAEQKDDKKPANIADAVRAALSSGKEQSSSSGEEGGKPGTETKAAKAAGEEEELGELTDEELASYKPKTQRRIQQFREQVKGLSTELADTRPLAERYIAFDRFCKDANLLAEDINTGMNVMKLMKNDPIKAYETLTPIYNTLQALVGIVLPSDLQQQVEGGRITKEAAQELSRLRASTGLVTEQKKTLDAQETKKRNDAVSQSAKKLGDDVGVATTDWEQRWKASDPDFALKHARVSEAIELELRKQADAGTLPRTVKDAVKMLDDVKTRVEREMQKLLPKRQAIKQTPQGPGSTNRSKPRANSVYEAVAQAVGHR